MKKAFLVAVVLTVAAVSTKSSLFSRYIKPQDNINLVSNLSEVNQQVLGAKNEVRIPDDNQEIKAVWYKVENIDNLKLIPNFTEKLLASEVKEKYNCEFLVNGGFYTKDNRPIGLFVSDNTKLRDYVFSSLLNSVLSVNDFKTPRITQQTPKDNLPMAVQNGPMLLENGSKKTLSLKSDKPARRVVAAVTGSNELVFIVFYNPKSAFEGPLLSELPDKVLDFNNQTKLNIADAINLDGGTASIFSSGNFNLTEASPVGSFFCE